MAWHCADAYFPGHDDDDDDDDGPAGLLALQRAGVDRAGCLCVNSHV